MSASPSEAPKVVLRWRFVVLMLAFTYGVGVPTAMALYGWPLWAVILLVPASAAFGMMSGWLVWFTQRETFERKGAPW